MPRQHSGAIALGALILTLGLVLAACSSAAAGSPGKSGHKATTTMAPRKSTATTLPPPPPGYVTIDGKRVRVPSEQRNLPINPVSDKGQHVIIYAHSFAPLTLAANAGTVVFTNLTDRSQSITFVNYPAPSDELRSGPIAPGATFKFHHLGSLAVKYVGSNSSAGYLNINLIPGL